MEAFYRFATKKLTIAEFETWVYATPELEVAVSEDDYLALITLNYKKPRAAYDLQQLLAPYIDLGELRRRELLEVLDTVANGGPPDDVLAALISMWNWYLNGCGFLDELAGYGERADSDFSWDPEGRWKSMSVDQKQSYLQWFYPDVQVEAIQIMDALSTGTIELRESANGEITYTDSRHKRRVMKPTTPTDMQAKPWWLFWK